MVHFARPPDLVIQLTLTASMKALLLETKSLAAIAYALNIIRVHFVKIYLLVLIIQTLLVKMEVFLKDLN